MSIFTGVFWSYDPGNKWGKWHFEYLKISTKLPITSKGYLKEAACYNIEMIEELDILGTPKGLSMSLICIPYSKLMAYQGLTQPLV